MDSNQLAHDPGRRDYSAAFTDLLSKKDH